MAGKFITFEGPDGAGKTTVLKLVAEQLNEILGDQMILTREPGGNPISEQIRNIILDRKNTEMDVRTEALLYAAARRQHLVETILPALQSDKIVLCDRYVDSSIAYQGAGREIGEQEVADMNLFATGGLTPDLTLYFEVPVTVGLARIKQHRAADDVDRLDLEKQAFHDRVHSAYEKLAQENPERIRTIDATQPVEKVVNETLMILKQALNK
ncbi:thymidylate kinase [Secundilactobacillus oryzae JCM 18671]|uniref:Thymidylate kinase n=1 Tax=Secundilactobacillus oryzae JCM 18671 TaxID=1291743 RepID=A0A081BK07_9LACO|nr:dTMP kinase [Secundilactobacillus oryzae]GAK48375.1 thymidylate kinase [Secundilactobacillus oryzae JCM 18671]